MTNTTSPDFATALDQYVAALNAASAAYYARAFPTLSPSTYSIDPNGRKYVRIVSTVGGTTDQRSVHVFVERATGLIWKADGWKKPTLNKSRGSIYSYTSEPDVLRIGR